MDKEQYLHLRNSGQIDLNLAWEYYNQTESWILDENGNTVPKLPFPFFMQLFQMWLSSGMATLERFYKHYDIKFGVNKLTQVNGNYKYI